MTLPTMWIRKNMLQSPGVNHERPLTEAEIKVQKSIKKLSIPEWYLNNNSRPLKILMNDTPIESRPSSWKEPSVKKKRVSTPVASSKCPSGKTTEFLETEIGASIFQDQFTETSKSPKKSPTKKSSYEKKSYPEKKVGNPRHLNISQTFPRVSPSRKIENINIIFSEQPKISLIDTIINNEEFSTLTEMSKDSLDTTESPEIINQNFDYLNFPQNLSRTNFSPEKIYPTPKKYLTYIKPWKKNTRKEFASCVTPIGKFKTDENFKLRSSSTPQNSPISLFSFNETNNSSPENCQRSPVATPRRTNLNIEKKEDPSKFPSNEPSKKIRPSTGFRPRNLLPSIGENRQTSNKKEENPENFKADDFSNSKKNSDDFFNSKKNLDDFSNSKKNSDDFSNSKKNSDDFSNSKKNSDDFFNSKKKSCHLESLVKRRQEKKPVGKSLVQEIIEELQEKCQTSSIRPSYVSPGSKNFVKKLVQALESGVAPICDVDKSDETSWEDSTNCQKEIDEYEENNAFIESENGSEDDIKSAASSTSISFKDSDSSDTDLSSPTNKLRYDWNMNMEKNGTEATKIIEEIDNDSVYWIPITKCKLPRTSSLLSMVSRLTINNPDRQSPCLSPISSSISSSTNDCRKIANVEPISSQSWGTTFRAKKRGGRLFRIDETAVLDSGYSDRSGGRSSRSSIVDEIWSDETDMHSEAGIGSCNESFQRLTSIYSERGLIAGGSFVI